MSYIAVRRYWWQNGDSMEKEKKIIYSGMQATGRLTLGNYLGAMKNWVSLNEEMFKGLEIDKFYKEKVSGKNIKDRPELNKMMEYVRQGDTVIVESISRFGRSLPDLIELMNKLDEKGVHFKSLKEGDIDTTTATEYAADY